VVVISSFVPLMTPFVMPFRIATDTVSSLHVWLSLGGAALFTGLLAYISLIFYRANVLIYSDTNFINTLKQSWADRKSTRLNSSHVSISYAVFCLKKKI